MAEVIKNHCLWPQVMLSALPDLLTELLTLPDCQSLERLQLVSMSISLKNFAVEQSPGDFRQIKMAAAPKIGDFLLLSAELFQGEKHLLDVSIAYFKRGARKFFSHPPLPWKTTAELSPFSLSARDVDDFFADIGQSNDFWSNEDIAVLNGRSGLVAPSQLLIAKILSQALASMGEMDKTDKANEYLTYKINFHEAITLGESIATSYQKGPQGFHLSISADGEPRVSLAASA